MKNLATLALMAGLLIFGGCGSDEIMSPSSDGPVAETDFPVAEGEGETIFSKYTEPTGNIVDTAIEAGFNTLVAAVIAADLAQTLAEGGPFTVFAPTDEAFADLPAGLVDALLMEENKGKLQELLTYHVLSGAVKSRDLRFYQKVETLQGDDLKILRFFRLIKVNDARVTLADVLATNGVIHVINKVLIPEGFTLEDPETPELNIVETAIAAGFSTLVAAAGAADLGTALAEGGPFTVFAPTNAAFEALPPGLVDELLLEQNKGKLQELLLYHVVDGAIQSGDLKRFQFVKMKNGRYSLVRKGYGGTVRINRSTVETPDVLATNGVIHVIDRVLIPYSFYGAFSSLPVEPPADHPALQMAR